MIMVEEAEMVEPISALKMMTTRRAGSERQVLLIEDETLASLGLASRYREGKHHHSGIDLMNLDCGPNSGWEMQLFS